VNSKEEKSENEIVSCEEN